MNKSELRDQHLEEFEARWKLDNINKQLELLYKKRQKAHAEWIAARDKTRNLPPN